MGFSRTKRVLAGSLLAASTMLFFRSDIGNNGYRQKEPIVDIAQKPKSVVERAQKTVYIDLMAHDTHEQAACDLPSALEQYKPDAVFFESMGTNKEEKSRIDTLMNKDILDWPDAVIGVRLAHEYKLRRIGVKLHFAEGYSGDEIFRLQKLLEDGNNLSYRAAPAYNAHDPLLAIDLLKRGEKITANFMLLRNNQIVKTILETDFENAVLFVGSIHIPIRRMLREAGVKVAFVKNVYNNSSLAIPYEEQMRGWAAQVDENKLAIRMLLETEIANEYIKLGFGNNPSLDILHFKIVAHQALAKREISLDEFIEMHRRGDSCTLNVIDCLKGFDIYIPDTREKFDKALKDAGIYGCR